MQKLKRFFIQNGFKMKTNKEMENINCGTSTGRYKI